MFRLARTAHQGRSIKPLVSLDHASGLDQLELSGTHLRVLGGLVAKPAEPGGGPHETDGAEDDKDHSPGHHPEQTVTSRPVSPPPRWAPAKKIPCAVPRSVKGSQREKVFDTLGKAPASPMPKRKRTTSSDT